MHLKTSLTGNLAEILEKELKNAEVAVTRGISAATNQLKDTMRKQVKSARLGLVWRTHGEEIFFLNQKIV